MEMLKMIKEGRRKKDILLLMGDFNAREEMKLRVCCDHLEKR